MHSPDSLKTSAPGIWKILRHFSPEIRAHRGLVAGGFLALLAEVLLRLLEPWPLKFVFDRVLPTTPAGDPTRVSFLDFPDPMHLLVLSALAVVVFSGLRALAAYGSAVGFALAGNRVVTKVRNDLYNRIQCLPLSFHHKSRTGDLLVRVIGDIALLQEVTVTAALPLVGNFLLLAGMMGVMLWMNPPLALLALAVVPLFWLITVRLGRRIRDVSRRQRRNESAMAATAAESLSTIKTVQSLSLEGAFSENFSSESGKSLSEGVKAKRLSARLERTVDLLVAVATALVLFYGSLRVIRGALTPGDLIVFLAYLKNAFKPLRNFAKYTGRLAKAAAAGERVVDLMDRTPEVRDLPGAVAAPAFQGSVRFDNVNFSYHPGEPTLEGIDFEVPPGQRVALVGPSGSGKSTLVSLILRLYDPSEGRILIDGKDIRSFTLESLRTQISVVLQDTFLFAASVRDNIAYGAPNAVSDEEIVAAARLARAHDFICRLPEGYDTVVGERGATLSNGQRQRIGIARAAIRKSPILILDEPTTGLDQANEKMVSQALTDLARDRTTFLITHGLHDVPGVDSIFYLKNGRLSEQGSHSELIRAGGSYAAMFKLASGKNFRKDSRGKSHARTA